MRIPKKLKTSCFYVATSEYKAFSSWKNSLDAEACVGRFAFYQPVEFKEIVGIIAVNKHGKWWWLKKGQQGGATKICY